MNNRLTNLLPPERQRILFREYFLRLGVVIAVLVTILMCIAALLLLPTYVFLLRSESAKGSQLANVESILASADEKTLSAHLTALSKDAAVLVALGKLPSPSVLVRSALAVPRSGVTVSGLVYAPATSKTPSTLAISGVATTRDALRSYQLALQSAPFAANADLPVSAYAQDADISFTITVTLTP
ncbi:MAG: hypothetical protein WA058_00400 [Minisyncoccia bacterium]